jgi:hypothetical protein
MAEGRGTATSVGQEPRSAGLEQPESCSLPAQPETECECSAIAKGWGIAAVLLGITGFVIQPLLLGPVALAAGIVSVRMRFRIGWLGIGLGAVQLAYVAVVLSQITGE